MSEKLLRLGGTGGTVPMREVEGITQPFGDVIAVVTKEGRHYLAQYGTHKEADADLTRMMDEWDAWGATQ